MPGIGAIFSGLVAFLQLALAIVQKLSQGQLLAAGRAEAEAAANTLAADKADAMAQVAANPSSDDDVERRLRDGSF